MLVWRMPSNVLVRSRSHTPQLFEPVVSYEEDTCFNCGGSFLIESGSGEFGHSKQICPMCDGVGECFVAYPTYTFYEWVLAPPPNVVIFLLPDGQINWPGPS